MFFFPSLLGVGGSDKILGLWCNLEEILGTKLAGTFTGLSLCSWITNFSGNTANKRMS